MSMDKRPEAEIQVGTALNAVETLEFDLDDLLAKAMKDDVTPPALLHELSWARHHIYQARICVARVFDHIEKEGAGYLGSTRSLDDAHAEMKKARAHGEDMKVHLEECSNPIFVIVSKRDKQW